MNTQQTSRYRNLKEFYPFYLSQHQNRTCRRLHFLGSFCALVLFILSLSLGHYALLLGAILSGYAFAWIGHFFFEKNRPATFTYPLLSFLSDWVMFRDILVGKIKF